MGYDNMVSGKLYSANKGDLRKISLNTRRLLDEFNSTGYADFEKRQELTKELLGSVDGSINMNKPFYCDYGINIHIGKNFYSNFDLVILDVNRVYIGDNVMFGPKVAIYTATHPIDPIIRNSGLEYGLEVRIGNNVWLGGNVVVNPGVTIGDNVVVGSGSVVTKDIPSNTVAAGNPAKVLRAVTNEDYVYWNKLKEEYK